MKTDYSIMADSLLHVRTNGKSVADLLREEYPQTFGDGCHKKMTQLGLLAEVIEVCYDWRDSGRMWEEGQMPENRKGLNWFTPDDVTNELWRLSEESNA